MCGCVGECWVLLWCLFAPRVILDSCESKFLTPCGVSITTQIFLDFLNAPQILYFPPRLLPLGPEIFSLHYTFKVYVALEPYGLLFQKFVSLGNAQKRNAVIKAVPRAYGKSLGQRAGLCGIEVTC